MVHLRASWHLSLSAAPTSRNPTRLPHPETVSGMVIRRSAALGAALVGAFALGAAEAQAQGTQVGNLSCQVSGGIGLIVTSQKELACTFKNTRGELEVYTGVIRRFGLDVGATTGGQLAWAVF